MVLILLGKTLVGVPQGSVQGPLQNILGINFQAANILFLKKLMFAYYQKLKQMTHFQTPSFSQAIECVEKKETKIVAVLYINEGIPGKLINSYNLKEGPGIIVLEFSLSNKKWLLLGNYKLPSQNELSFINEIKLSLNFFSSSYENFFLLGDFNFSTENPKFKNLLNSFDFESH